VGKVRKRNGERNVTSDREEPGTWWRNVVDGGKLGI
jgi:hypothetical protein